MKKIMLVYPPGEIYQRGEDRCQVNVEASVANSIRACNDIGYIASGLKQLGYMVFLKDYPAERASMSDFEADINIECPDVVFISITNGSIFSDLEAVKRIKKLRKNTVIILKGALFFNVEEDFLSNLDLEYVDYLVSTESEFVVPLLIDTHYNDRHNVKELQGISYKKDGKWITNRITNFIEDLDSLHFPDRSLMKNYLYINPDTNKPMATIVTSKGCPFNCIYCLSPKVSGHEVRYRSANSIFEEMKECFEKYKIDNFFFKADTFTVNRNQVIEICDLIEESNLHGKINWVANSRVNTLDEELVKRMKSAGCSMIALGIESGSDESLIRMQKGTTVDESIKTVELLKRYKMKIWGFYLVGFPWETKEHLKQTEDLIFKLDTDFIELSIVTPYKGTELYLMLKDKIDYNILGKDAFKYPVSVDENISIEKLDKYRKNIILKYHLRPGFILHKLLDETLTIEVLMNYIKYGFRLIKNSLLRRHRSITGKH